jgi:hypothetical protein
MTVVGEHIREPFAPHHMHRNTIRQAVFLVWTTFIESQTVLKQRLIRRKDLNVGISQNTPCSFGGTAPRCLPCSAEEGEKLRQHPLGCHQCTRRQGAANGKRSPVLLVAAVKQGDPICRIRKDGTHTGRLGVP